MKAKIAVLLLICALLFGAVSVLVSAEESDAVEATIDTVYGGRAGIVTMTFDDGNYDTAVVVDELLETYGLRATVMMLASRVKNGAGKWEAMFETGRLAVQNHSMTHIGFRKNNPDDEGNLNEETYKYEIIDSGDFLEEIFPEYDMVSYAIPYGGWCDEAAAVAASKYYMIRSTTGGVQELDPGFELNVNGSWSNLKCVSINTQMRPNQLTELKSQVDEAALGGWLCTITHHVGSMDAYELTYNEADELFSYISDYEKMGVLWVTDTESATKYVRERQNATLTARKSGANIYLSATLADTTEDGLPLGADVFDYPLTVKVAIDADVDTVYYYDGCVEKSAEVFTEGGRRYARVELVPNGEELVLYPTPLEKETLPHSYKDATCTEPKTCEMCGFAVGEVTPHNFSEPTCSLPKICEDCGEYEGDPLGHDYTEATCTAAKTCLRCGKVSGKAKKHEYLNATCSEPQTCKNCGATTGTALGHVIGAQSCADEKCARCENIVPTGIAHDYADATCGEPKSCKVCGTTDGAALGHDYLDATCTEPKMCKICGEADGAALGHSVDGDTCASGECTVCGQTVSGTKAHDYTDATCTEPKTCKVCGESEGDPLGHDYTAPSCSAPSVCIRCNEEGEEALAHTVISEGIEGESSHRIVCSVCDKIIAESEAHGDADSDGKCDKCGQNLDTGAGEGNATTVIIIAAVSAVAVGGGAAAVIVVRKKRNK